MSLAGRGGDHSVFDVDIEWVGGGAIGGDKRFIKASPVGVLYTSVAWETPRLKKCAKLTIIDTRNYITTELFGNPKMSSIKPIEFYV